MLVFFRITCPQQNPWRSNLFERHVSDHVTSFIILFVARSKNTSPIPLGSRTLNDDVPDALPGHQVVGESATMEEKHAMPAQEVEDLKVKETCPFTPLDIMFSHDEHENHWPWPWFKLNHRSHQTLHSPRDPTKCMVESFMYCTHHQKKGGT